MRARFIVSASSLPGIGSGKSDVGSYEVACHLTGLYPHWWKGRRFDRPIKAWAAGDTSKTVRDIIQPKLVGEQGQYGKPSAVASFIRASPKDRRSFLTSEKTPSKSRIRISISILARSCGASSTTFSTYLQELRCNPE